MTVHAKVYTSLHVHVDDAINICNWFCRSYIGMTAHWIDEDTLKREHAVLVCERLKGSYTYDVLAKAISGTYWKFGIENQVVSATTDNGSNFVKAFR